jgi:hypothetical protein
MIPDPEAFLATVGGVEMTLHVAGWGAERPALWALHGSGDTYALRSLVRADVLPPGTGAGDLLVATAGGVMRVHDGGDSHLDPRVLDAIATPSLAGLVVTCELPDGAHDPDDWSDPEREGVDLLHPDAPQTRLAVAVDTAGRWYAVTRPRASRAEADAAGQNRRLLWGRADHGPQLHGRVREALHVILMALSAAMPEDSYTIAIAPEPAHA